MSDEQTPTPTEGEPDTEHDEANSNGGPTWQHERFSTSYPNSSRPDDDEPEAPSE